MNTIINYPIFVLYYLYCMIRNALGFSDESKESCSEPSSASQSDGEIEFEQNVMYFDFETTGLNPYHDKVIELCFLNDTPRILEKEIDYISKNTTDEEPVFEDEHYLATLVNPKRKFDEKITNITGIHPYDLINKPCIEELYPIIVNFLDNGMDNYLVAHNCHGFDEIILKGLLRDANGKHVLQNICFIDTLLLARKLMPELYRFSQKALCDYFKIETKSHRADEDCKALRSIYHKLLGVYRKRISKEYSLEELINNPVIIYEFLYN